MLFSYVSGQQWIWDNKKCRQIAGDFNFHEDVGVQCRAHGPIEHIQGFTWSHWMLPLGERLHCIALAAAMVDGFVETTLNTNETQRSPSKWEFCTPKTDPLLGYWWDKLCKNVRWHNWSWRARIWASFEVDNFSNFCPIWRKRGAFGSSLTLSRSLRALH